METRFLQCKQCGAELDFATGKCPYCEPEPEPAEAALVDDAPFVVSDEDDGPVFDPGEPVEVPEPVAPPPPVVVAAPVPSPAQAESDRVFGLILFDAEEEIARGNTEKAMVLASRAVKERPDNLTARALYERARRDLVKGRRREKLDERVREAERLQRLGDRDGAAKIVASALKFVPDHPLALKLYAKLREDRLQHDSAEAEAERELDGLMRQQARQALDAARAALAGRRERHALQALRRGLRLVPDEPELLAMLQDVNARLEAQNAERFRQLALQAQLRDGVELLEEGRFDEAARVLEVVLAEQPGNARAAEALERARRRELPPGAVAAEEAAIVADAWPEPVVPAPVPVAAAPPPPAPKPVPAPAAPPLEPPPAPAPAPEPIRVAAPPPEPAVSRPATPPSMPRPATVPIRRELPPEIRVRRTAPTPLPYVLGAAAILALPLAWYVLREDDAPSRRTATTPAPTLPATTVPATTAAASALAGLGPDARAAVERSLEQYALALEGRDPDRLELARPDLTPAEREALLAALKPAATVSAELEVLDVTVQPDGFTVTVLRNLVVVGADVPARTEETFRYAAVDGAWRLRRP